MEDSSVQVLGVSCNAVYKSKSTKDVKLWHLRLVHMPVSQLNLVTDVKIGVESLDWICQVCAIARQTKFPFSHSSIKTTLICLLN